MDIPMGIFARASHLDSALPLRYDEFYGEMILDPDHFRHAMHIWTTGVGVLMIGVNTPFMTEAAEAKFHSKEVPMTDQLTFEDKQILLRLARQALELGVRGEKLPPLDKDSLSPQLCVDGASFVTLTVGGALRGCIGALEAYQPLVEDVREHALAAALSDYRFPPVQVAELEGIHIEVSRLTAPVQLEYADPEDLVAKLRPGVDGVILRDGNRRATFLPQVWEQLPGADDFLGHLCSKMGAASDLWRHKHLNVQTYQVEEFHE